MKRWGWLAAACLLLAGCTETPSVGLRQGPASSPPAPATAESSTRSTADLAARKQAAGIADCPASDPQARVVPGGLPDVVLSCLGGGRDVRLAGLRGLGGV